MQNAKTTLGSGELTFIKNRLHREKAEIDRRLVLLTKRRFPGVMGEASAYTVTAGGKRLRPALMVSVHRALGGSGRTVYSLSLSIELVHAYSLIHDDLPQLDNDDYRRGKPTCHTKYGVGTAIVAGVDLIRAAVENLVRTGRRARLEPDIVRRLTAELMRASGVYGLVGGQVADILHETREFDEETVEFIHTHKTAVLFAASCAMGSILSGAPRSKVDAVREYGMQLGFAFQIIDDILDATGTFEDLGKRVGKDERMGKATCPALLGIEGAREKARIHVANTSELLRRAAIVDRFLYLFPYWILRAGNAPDPRGDR